MNFRPEVGRVTKTLFSTTHTFVTQHVFKPNKIFVATFFYATTPFLLSLNFKMRNTGIFIVIGGTFREIKDIHL
jgi:hypothetical protein